MEESKQILDPSSKEGKEEVEPTSLNSGVSAESKQVKSDSVTDIFTSKVLLTGASGNIGSQLRKSLKTFAQNVILTDIIEPKDLAEGETFYQCELSDLKAVQSMMEGVTSIIHMGGISTDGPFLPIMNVNILGVYNLYEAARIAKVKRIIYASSSHAVGFHTRDTKLDAQSEYRPDSNYGLSKVFGESLARLYYDRYGIESVCLRIGHCFPKPVDRYRLNTWLSYDDMSELIKACLTQPQVGFTIHYGVSNNPGCMWDNSKSSIVGYSPKDSSEKFKEEVFKNTPDPDPNNIIEQYHGAEYVAKGPYNN